tara:strand:- start:192 stop:2633 length:2442 start_codon:yes stop_codon:yes gene_type:complete
MCATDSPESPAAPSLATATVETVETSDARAVAAAISIQRTMRRKMGRERTQRLFDAVKAAQQGPSSCLSCVGCTRRCKANGMSWDLVRTRARRILQKHEVHLACFSVVYLIIILVDLVMEEIYEEGESPFAQGTWFTILDTAFSVGFLSELLLRVAVEGFRYLRSCINVVDASTIVLSLILAILTLTDTMDMNFSVMRLFRLIRLIKVAIAINRVRQRTLQWRDVTAKYVADPPKCDWARARRINRARFSATASQQAPGTSSRPRSLTRQMSARVATAASSSQELATVPSAKKPSKKFAAFLSHYKVEAGSDARYLCDKMQKMLGNVPVFIDSNDLADLNDLRSAVENSEVLVLLATRNALQRPWVLLELYEAVRTGVPVVTLATEGHEYNPDDARDWLDPDGRCALSSLSRHDEGLIKSHLATTGDSWEAFEGMVKYAVDPDAEEGGYGPPLFQEWHSWGTDQQVTGEIRDLITSMGMQTNRLLQWSETETVAPKVRPSKTLCERVKGLCGLGAAEEAEFGCYICFDQKEGSSAARILQKELQDAIGKPVLLGGWHGVLEGEEEEVGDQIENVLDQLKQVELGVVVLLTESVLHSPLTLMELYEAFKLHKPVVPIEIKQGSSDRHTVQLHSYDFDCARELLHDLPKRLPTLLDEQKPGSSTVALRMLAARGVSLNRLSSMLSHHIPNLIAMSVHLPGSEHQLQATCTDAIRRMQRKRKMYERDNRSAESRRWDSETSQWDSETSQLSRKPAVVAPEQVEMATVPEGQDTNGSAEVDQIRQIVGVDEDGQTVTADVVRQASRGVLHQLNGAYG